MRECSKRQLAASPGPPLIGRVGGGVDCEEYETPAPCYI